LLSLVECPSLDPPTNGMISCTLGDGDTANPGESCSFSCNDGFELRGSDTRTCQNDRSWSGTNTTCVRGKLCCILVVRLIRNRTVQGYLMHLFQTCLSANIFEQASVLALSFKA